MSDDSATAWPPGDSEMAERIRRNHWDATSLGPVSHWSDRLKLMIEQVLASPLVSSLVCGPERLLIYNDAAAQLYGDRHPGALGRPLPAVFPEGWETVAPLYERAFLGETVRVVGQPLDTRGEGSAYEVFDAFLSPVRDGGGHIAYVHMMGSEVAERARLEAALRESEERYRTLFEVMDTGFAINELVRDEEGKAVDLRYLEFNPALEKLVGWSAKDTVGRLMSEKFTAAETAKWVSDFDGIIKSGMSAQSEHYHQSLDMWFRANASPMGGDRVALIYQNTTAEKRAEIAQREERERQDFLLRFSDTLRTEETVDAVAMRAIQLLFDQLRLDRCYIAYYRPEADEAIFPYQIGNDTVPPLPEMVRLSDFPEAYEQVLDQTFVINDDYERRGLSEDERANSRGLGMRAMLASTVRRGEKNPLSSMMAVSSSPRQWSAGEIALVEEIAERTWSAIERVRAEVALRESEERFQQFAHASAAGLWIRKAETLAMEYVSPAAGAIYGVEPDALLGDVKHWAAIVVPEDREVALNHLDKPRHGDVAVHEFRIQRPSDGAFRWIRDTNFPLRNNGHVPRIGGIAEDITERRQLIEHQGVLLAELQHRVRNIMGMIRSMANRTAPGASAVDDYRSLIEGRLLALARVQALLTREANAGGSLRGVIETEVMAQAHHGGQFHLTGPDIPLAPKAVEVLTLAFHELATNALKYGALSVPDGRLSVTWTLFEKRGRPWLSVDWIEEGAPPRKPSTRRGFGSELIEARIPYELGGRGAITIAPEGAHCHLEFPLKGGESILETDAPQPATIFGGTLDMTGAPDLSGRLVLVVEDDYYMANDTAAALRGAGAEVLGPCPNEDAMRDLLEDAVPTHAVLDLNLGGGGPNFDIARLLKEQGVPFVFLTGYDPNVIPPDMANVVRLQKPLPFREIVEAVGQL